MLVLPALHTYLNQLLSPPSIHTALLLTPEGALVSYASQMTAEGSSTATSSESHTSRPGSSGTSNSSILGPSSSSSPSTPRSKRSSGSSTLSSAPSSSNTDMLASEPPQRTKDEIRIVAGLSAEVWAETKGQAEGMVESEVGRILVIPVEEEREEQKEGPAPEPLLLLAANGTLDADWDVMSLKAHKLAAFLAPSVNKHRGLMGTPSSNPPVNGAAKSRTRSAATSPGRAVNR